MTAPSSAIATWSAVWKITPVDEIFSSTPDRDVGRQDQRRRTVGEIRCQMRPYLDVPVAHDRRAQVAQRQRGGQRGRGGLRALVLGRVGQPGPVQRLLLVVRGEHAVGDRGRRVQRHPGQALGHRVAHVVEMRCLAADHHAQAPPRRRGWRPVPVPRPGSRSRPAPAPRSGCRCRRRRRPCVRRRAARRRSCRARCWPRWPASAPTRRAVADRERRRLRSIRAPPWLLR